MSYVDGYVLPVPKKHLQKYRRMAQKGAEVWRDHGALQYFECMGEDLDVRKMKLLPFPKLMKVKPGETVVFAFVVFKSRAHRDRVNAKVMKDERIAGDDESMPFDMKRMAYGGFETIVEA